MKEEIICIASPAGRTYYRAQREQNVIHTTGTLPEGEITEIAASSATIKNIKQGKLHGSLKVLNLADGSVSLQQEYQEGVLQQSQAGSATESLPVKTTPKHTGTTLKTTKDSHSFYINGKEVAEETISSNGATLELLGNIPDGEVKEFNENDQVITIAQYKNNKLNGELTRYTDDGKLLSREIYADGLLQGGASYMTFTQEGLLTAICHYKNSRLHGERTLSGQNGSLRCREFYKNGHLNGPRVCYYENGKKASEENYSDGKLTGKREFFFPQGDLWYSENYSNGRLDGERFCFFPNGKLYLEEFYTDGLLEGHRNIYSENGDLLTSEEYHWGALTHNTERKKI